MATWKKHFQVVPTKKIKGPSPLNNEGGGGASTGSKYASWLPEVYSGQPNRIERYTQYDQMDMDSEINASLDTIADFCTQVENNEDLPFEIVYHEDPTETETELLDTALRQWTKLNDFRRRIWRIMRNTIKYGDQFFIRDPETYEWMWVDHSKVKSIIADEASGKEPEQYLVQDLDLNIIARTATSPSKNGTPQYNSGFGGGQTMAGALPLAGAGSLLSTGTAGQSRFGQSEQTIAVDAEHVVHISLSEGMDINWPFGNSILEAVFKTYKQKELLEDALIIYRVQRAPERRVFYVDVGNMPAHKAMAYVERIKNEIHQRRIPNRTGGGTSILDAAYNPLSIIEDYFFAQCLHPNTTIPLLDGRTITLADAIREYENGETNWVYSLNLETHEFEPAKITWGGYTRRNAQLVRVHLDNGEYIDSTPDHRFILRDGLEIEAQFLQPNDSLMPLYLHDAKTDKIQHSKKYTRYTCNATGKKKWVHTAVCPKTKTGTVIHHVDCNSRNNNPENLIEMDRDAHTELHKEIGTYALTTMWQSEKGADKIKAGMRRMYDTADDQFRQMLSTRNRKNGANTWSGKNAVKVRANLDRLHKLVPEAKKLRVTDEMFKLMKDALVRVGNTISKRKFCRDILPSCEEFMRVYAEANTDRKRDKGRAFDCFDEKILDRLVKHGGYESWDKFKKTFANNHKVVRVEWLEDRADTCDITVEGKSMSHVFAVLAGVYVHNSAEGRGSKVETLPGGENLGEIDDLKYFNNKLFRGLRVPSSYLPTGPDDGTAQYSDGRVGTAYIQEWRFSKYCQRLQNIVSPVFDREFKLFLKRRGIEIHPTFFEIAFHEPQNFGDFKRMEVDSQRLGIYGQVAQVEWLSKRFAAQRYLGLSEEEILENERMWKEENISKVKSKSGKTGSENAGGGLRDVGIGGGGGGLDLGGGMDDMDMGGDAGGESPISGGENMDDGDAAPTGGDAGGGLTL